MILVPVSEGRGLRHGIRARAGARRTRFGDSSTGAQGGEVACRGDRYHVSAGPHIWGLLTHFVRTAARAIGSRALSGRCGEKCILTVPTRAQEAGFVP